MDPKVIVILGLVVLVIFLFIVMGIIAWVSSGDDESTDDSTTGGSTTGGGTTGGGDNSGGTTGGGDNSGGDNSGGDNSGGTTTGGTTGGSSGEETCEDPGIYCIGAINWGGSVHHGKDCSEVRPGDLTGLTSEDELGFEWLEKAYNAGSNHKLIVKDKYGEICRDKEVICKGDSVDWPAVGSHSASVYDGQDCSAHAIAHNSNINTGKVNDKSLESYAALNWCRRAEENDLGCTIGIGDKN